MTKKEMIAEVKRLNLTIKELDGKRSDLTKAVRAACKHSKVVESYTYSCDDWDRTSTTWYSRKCLSCGTTDSAKVFKYDSDCSYDVPKYTVLTGPATKLDHKDSTNLHKAEIEL